MTRLQKILLAVFIFSIPFQARVVLFEWTAPFNEWTAGFLWAADILLALLVILNYKFLILNKKDWILIAFLAIAAVSISQAELVPVAIYRFIKLAEYVLLFFYFRQQKILSLFAIASVWVAACIFQALIGITQYVLQHDLGLRLFGESVLDPYGTAVAVVPAVNQLFLRAYGTTPHPNVLAIILMIGLWSAVWLYTKKCSSLILAAYGIIFLAFLLTFSRVAIVFWILATVAMLIVHRVRWREIMPPLLISVIVSVTIASILWPQVRSRLYIHAEDEAV